MIIMQQTIVDDGATTYDVEYHKDVKSKIELINIFEGESRKLVFQAKGLLGYTSAEDAVKLFLKN